MNEQKITALKIVLQQLIDEYDQDADSIPYEIMLRGHTLQEELVCLLKLSGDDINTDENKNTLKRVKKQIDIFNNLLSVHRSTQKIMVDTGDGGQTERLTNFRGHGIRNLITNRKNGTGTSDTN